MSCTDPLVAGFSGGTSACWPTELLGLNAMNNLETLRPEVAEAIRLFGAVIEELGLHDDYESALHVLCAELLRLTDENARLLAANRDAMDHFEQMQAELAALKARIANSCRADGQRVFDLLGLPIEYDGTLALVKVEE